MDTQTTFPIRDVLAGSHRSRRLAIAFGALVVGLSAAILLGSSTNRAPAAPAAADQAQPAQLAAAAPSQAAPQASAAAAAAAATRVSARSRSAVVVVMPDDHDLVLASSIPVAGKAFAGPHGPRTRSVHVALYVGGNLVAATDLDVYAGRFAGVLSIGGPVTAADAQLRFTDPASPSRPATIRSITIKVAASTSQR